MSAPKITGIDHLVITVEDIAATVAFYTRVLGMTADSYSPADGSTRVALKFAGQKINLHETGREFVPKALAPAAGSADFCLLTEAPLADWQLHLLCEGVAVEAGPVKRSGARGPITSLYLRDPDGNLIEIARYG